MPLYNAHPGRVAPAPGALSRAHCGAILASDLKALDTTDREAART